MKFTLHWPRTLEPHIQGFSVVLGNLFDTFFVDNEELVFHRVLFMCLFGNLFLPIHPAAQCTFAYWGVGKRSNWTNKMNKNHTTSCSLKSWVLQTFGQILQKLPIKPIFKFQEQSYTLFPTSWQEERDAGSRTLEAAQWSEVHVRGGRIWPNQIYTLTIKTHRTHVLPKIPSQYFYFKQEVRRPSAIMTDSRGRFMEQPFIEWYSPCNWGGSEFLYFILKYNKLSWNV